MNEDTKTCGRPSSYIRPYCISSECIKKLRHCIHCSYYCWTALPCCRPDMHISWQIVILKRCGLRVSLKGPCHLEADIHVCQRTLPIAKTPSHLYASHKMPDRDVLNCNPKRSVHYWLLFRVLAGLETVSTFRKNWLPNVTFLSKKKRGFRVSPNLTLIENETTRKIRVITAYLLLPVTAPILTTVNFWKIIRIRGYASRAFDNLVAPAQWWHEPSLRLLILHPSSSSWHDNCINWTFSNLLKSDVFFLAICSFS